MNILFKKTEETQNKSTLTFNGLGISQCYVKDLNVLADRGSILRTAHRHAFYEAHVMLSGSQDYEIGGERFTVSAGELLLIAPYTRHLAVCETGDYKKRAVTFALTEDSELAARLSHISSHAIAKASDGLLSLLDFLCAEKASGSAFSESISELATLECILLILRLAGARDDGARRAPVLSDTRVAMAKQFIQDNIQSTVSIRTLAAYCLIGEKQLSRIFYKEEACTIAEYIRIHKLKYIKDLLTNDTYTLRQISEMMNFSSEYYFNAFFKKYTGMTPGKYRKSVVPNK